MRVSIDHQLKAQRMLQELGPMIMQVWEGIWLASNNLQFLQDRIIA